MSVKVVIVLGVVLVLLFVVGVVAGVCNSSSPTNQGDAKARATTQAGVRERFDGVLAKPLEKKDVLQAPDCLTNQQGCAVSGTMNVTIGPSDDRLRQVRRATLVLSQGAALVADFEPDDESPASGRVRSKAELKPEAKPTPQGGRTVQLNVSQDGGKLTIRCIPPNVPCRVRLVL